MNEKLHRRTAAIASRFLLDDERIDYTGRANVGTTSLAKNAAILTAVAVASAGTVTAFMTPRSCYIVVTDTRLMLFGANDLSGGPTDTLVLSVDRGDLTVGEVKKGLLASSFRLTVRGMDKALKVTVPFAERKDGDRLVAVLSEGPRP